MREREAIDRIQEMETCFDMLTTAEQVNPKSILDDPGLKSSLQRLLQYYENGQWLHDYELDEKGLLPQDLKRGVLAQDAVYDFLDRMKNVEGFEVVKGRDRTVVCWGKVVCHGGKLHF